MKPFFLVGKTDWTFSAISSTNFGVAYFFVALSFERLRNKRLYPYVKTYKNVI